MLFYQIIKELPIEFFYGPKKQAYPKNLVGNAFAFASTAPNTYLKRERLKKILPMYEKSNNLIGYVRKQDLRPTEKKHPNGSSSQDDKHTWHYSNLFSSFSRGEISGHL